MSEEKPLTDAPGAETTAPAQETPDVTKKGSEPAVPDAPNPEPAADNAARTGTKSKLTGRLHMPGFGFRSHSDKQRTGLQPASPADENPRVTFEGQRTSSFPSSPLAQHTSNSSARHAWMKNRRTSIDPKLRPEEAAYHDSRAATKREYQRRATTLQEYYRENPTLLPQLPFTFRHGFKRWKLALLILFMVFDACVIPIILYYAMTFGGHVQGWITFAVVTAIWGGPAYFEFAVRSWRLIKKERFFRPLGTTSRWCFDISHWIFTVSITATTALLIVGAAPHIVWIRILSLPGPALLLVLGLSIGLLTVYSLAGWKAPFRISSTPKGGPVHPGVYYLVEDIVAVNAGGGLPFREGLAARYEASPIFRKMIRDQSIFWSVGAIAMSAALIVIVCVHTIKKEIVYGVGWATPFVWAAVWAVITVPWVRYELHRETVTWDEVAAGRAEKGPLHDESVSTTPVTNGATNGNTNGAVPATTTDTVPAATAEPTTGTAATTTATTTTTTTTAPGAVSGESNVGTDSAPVTTTTT